MPQFFIDRECSAGLEVEIRGADAHHILRVLRLARGDWLVLSDGNGRSFLSEISEIGTKRLKAVIGKEITPHTRNPSPVLALALIKSDRFEWAIQKVVEIGCGHIIPFRSQRTSSSYRENPRKGERWRQIASEAAKQSGLPFRPRIDEAVDFENICRISKGYPYPALLYEGEDKNDIRSYWRRCRSRPAGGSEPKHMIIIGPEGGFTNDEIKSAVSAKIATISLGPQILRVETAAISALTIWQYELGNMGI